MTGPKWSDCGLATCRECRCLVLVWRGACYDAEPADGPDLARLPFPATVELRPGPSGARRFHRCFLRAAFDAAPKG